MVLGLQAVSAAFSKDGVPVGVLAVIAVKPIVLELHHCVHLESSKHAKAAPKIVRKAKVWFIL